MPRCAHIASEVAAAMHQDPSGVDQTARDVIAQAPSSAPAGRTASGSADLDAPAQGDKQARADLVVGMDVSPIDVDESQQDPLLMELRATRPGRMARFVCRYPGLLLLLLFALTASSCLVAVFYPPRVNASFESLTVQDHPVNNAYAASADLISDSDAFWAAPLVDATQSAPRRALQQQQRGPTAAGPFRGTIDYTLHVVYRATTPGASMLDRPIVARIKALEDRIVALPGYERLCLHYPAEAGAGGARVCRRPVSAINFIYGSFRDGRYFADGEAAEAQDPVLAAQVLASQNMTYFFDADADFVTGRTSSLRSEYIFGAPADGTDSSDAASRRVYQQLCKDMYRVLRDAEDGELRVTFGGVVMTDWEVRAQLLTDARYVAIAVAVVVVSLAIGTRSIALTVAGVYEVAVSFPLAYAAYRAAGHDSLNIIQALAPYIVLGNGLDDIFVFVSIYKSVAAYSDEFPVETRLAVAYSRAFGAMLATSVTSAASFAANAVTPVPAVRLLGILLALLVAANFALAVTWMPVAVVVWDRYLHCGACGGRRGGRGRGLDASLAQSDPGTGGCSEADSKPVGEKRGNVRDGVIDGGSGAEAPVRARAAANAPGRRAWGAVFEIVWRGRVLFIAAVLAAAAAGAVLASRLQPSDALPKLFVDSHNVQQFIHLWATNYTEDSLGACAACLDLNNAVPLGALDAAVAASGAVLAGGSMPGAAPGTPFAESAVAAMPPSESAVAPVQPAESAVAPAPPVDVSAVPISDLGIDPAALTAARTNTATIPVAIVWGVRAVHGAGGDGDPFAADAAPRAVLDARFDLGDAAQQRAVLAQLSGLVNTTTGDARAGREALVSKLRWNVFAALRAYCDDVASAADDAPVSADAAAHCRLGGRDAVTGLPVGDAFHGAVWAMLRSGFEGDFSLASRSRTYRRSIGYDFAAAPSAAGISPDTPPRVRWLRFEAASATRESAAPRDILDSYDAWHAWAADAPPAQPRPLVASELWIQAVTDDAITRGIVSGIVLSAAVATAAVYVFTGSLVVTALAAATMAAINVFTLGMYRAMGWRLGAVEGVSITVLVGLSVDYCIHFTEAFVCSVLRHRRERARDATMLMGTSVLASAVSTVATAAPLWLTATVALRQFAAIIAINLSTAFVFSLLLLVPLLGVLGPHGRHGAGAAGVRPWWRAALASRLNRAGLACGLCLGIAAAVPASRRVLLDNPVIWWLGCAVVAVAAARALMRAACGLRMCVNPHRHDVETGVAPAWDDAAADGEAALARGSGPVQGPSRRPDSTLPRQHSRGPEALHR